MTGELVVLCSSPSPTSRSAFVVRALATEAERAGARLSLWSLADFDAADVLAGRAGAPAVARFVEATRGAAAMVLTTPVYKASYSGALKAVVDLIPPDALVGRPALGVATARLPAHAGEVDRSFRALFAFFQARPVDTLVVLDDELRAAGSDGHALSEGAQARLRVTTHELLNAIASAAGETERAAAGGEPRL